MSLVIFLPFSSPLCLWFFSGLLSHLSVSFSFRPFYLTSMILLFSALLIHLYVSCSFPHFYLSSKSLVIFHLFMSSIYVLFFSALLSLLYVSCFVCPFSSHLCLLFVFPRSFYSNCLVLLNHLYASCSFRPFNLTSMAPVLFHPFCTPHISYSFPPFWIISAFFNHFSVFCSFPFLWAHI